LFSNQDYVYDGERRPYKKMNYLDSFPFPYYIVLRDIEALPRTLGDVLRQVTFHYPFSVFYTVKILRYLTSFVFVFAVVRADAKLAGLNTCWKRKGRGLQKLSLA